MMALEVNVQEIDSFEILEFTTLESMKKLFFLFQKI